MLLSSGLNEMCIRDSDVAVDMQALAKEKSRMMHQGVASAIPGSKA